MPVDPSFAVSGAEWQVPGLADPAGDVRSEPRPEAAGFGDMLAGSVAALSKTQTDAAGAAQSFAAGTVSDPTEVVMAVERARLSMQMAAQIRTKAVEAYQDIFHTQV